MFLVTSDQLIAVSPVAPRKCCALHCEITKMCQTCVDDFQNGRGDISLERATAAIRWLGNTFPAAFNEDGAVEEFSWIAADEQRQLEAQPIYVDFAPLGLLAAPLRVCILDDGPVSVVVVATEDGRIHIMLVDGNVFTPIWCGSSMPLKVQRVESLLLLEAEHAYFARFEVHCGELYYIHSHGVSVINVRWVQNIKDGSGLDNLPDFVAKRQSIFHHLIKSSDPFRNASGVAILRDDAPGPETILCVWLCLHMLPCNMFC